MLAEQAATLKTIIELADRFLCGCRRKRASMKQENLGRLFIDEPCTEDTRNTCSNPFRAVWRRDEFPEHSNAMPESRSIRGVRPRTSKSHGGSHSVLMLSLWSCIPLPQRDMRDLLERVQKAPATLASIPKGTPTRKSWYVERRRVMETVLGAFRSGTPPRLVGLVGGSGSGKTTAASEIVRSTEVQEIFSDGIVWLTVNQNKNLQSLMLDLALMVFEDVDGSVGHRPTESTDGAAYVKEQMEIGHGKGMKCLVVADNVWEMAVVSKLLETGMWVLLSTRDESLVAGSDGEIVGVDELSQVDAESVLRRAAELPSDVHLPDDAVNLIDLCGRVAMDLAFVGRWSRVRRRRDRKAWSGATAKVRSEMREVECHPEHETPGDTRHKWRMAILRAGFEELATGVGDERVKRLYLSLAVLPNGHAFTAHDAAVLLYESPDAEDEASVVEVLHTLERWTAVRRSEDGTYRVHDAHWSFAKQKLGDRGDVRRLALQRWVGSISSFHSLHSIDRYTLKRLWRAVEDVGGDGWDITRPYVKALTEMDESDPWIARENSKAVARFQVALEDWEGASTTWLRLLQAEVEHRGVDHPYVLNAYEHLADLAERAGNPKKASEWREKVSEALPSALAKMKSKLGGSGGGDGFDGVGLASLALTMLTLTGDNGQEAERLLRWSLEIREATLGPEHTQVAFTLHHLGAYLRYVGRIEEAEELLRRCLDIKRRKVAKKHVTTVADTVYELGVCVRDAGRLEEAQVLLKECLDVREATLGPEHEQVVCTAKTLQELNVYRHDLVRQAEENPINANCAVV